jgi:hypothetical protein
MKIFIALALAALVTTLPAVAQDTRDVASQMGADTTTSVSMGTDRYGVHEDTETVGEPPQQAPNLLGPVQASKGNKLSKTERKRLLQERQLLLKDRKAYSRAAVVKAKKAEMAGKGRNLSLMNKQAIVNEDLVRKNAERAWDAMRKGKELQEIDRALREGSYGSAEVRLHAPSLVNPK